MQKHAEEELGKREREIGKGTIKPVTQGWTYSRWLRDDLAGSGVAGSALFDLKFGEEEGGESEKRKGRSSVDEA